MPVVTTSIQFNMSTVTRDDFVSVLTDGELVSSSSTEVVFRRTPGASFSDLYTFFGSGFGAPDADGFPTTGTLTNIRFDLGNGGTYFLISGLSIPVSQFNAALASADPSVLVSLLFDGADVIHGDMSAGLGETLYGHGGNDQIYGYDGQDLIYGGDGGDTIEGGDETGPTAGSYGDAIDGQAGNDTINGGQGRDILVGGEGSDTIDGGLGNDLIYDGTQGFTSVEGSTFISPALYDVRINFAADVLAVDQDVDTLSGGDGSDTVVGGLGDIMDGGAGSDTADISFVHDDIALHLDLSAAMDVGFAIASHSGGSYANFEFYTIRGTTFGDTLIGTTANNVFYGGLGSDLLEGRDGADQLIGSTHAFNSITAGRGGYSFDDAAADDLLGGEGADTLSVGILDRADGGNGTDTLNITLVGLTAGVTLDLTIGDRFATLASASGGSLNGFENISYIATTNFADVLRVAHSGNFYTLDGDDLFEGNDLVQFVGGNAGDDTISTLGGNDRVWGGDGDDLVQAGDGDDYIYADEDNTGSVRTYFSGNDTLDGGAGNDFLFGGGGDDLIMGGAGVDVIDGGDGFDAVDYSTSSAAVQITLYDSFAQQQGGDAQGDSFTSIERVIGSGWNDGLYAATSSGVSFDGGAGNDSLQGSSYADTLAGGSGNDSLNGGGGVDTADYSAAAAGVHVRLDQGVASNDGDGGTDTLAGIENLTGSAFNDTLFGSSGVNLLRGGAGRDVILGLGGNDVIHGGAGLANELYGGLGDDTYVLEAADSVIESAGQGTDTVQTSSLSAYNLGAEVENLTYTGTGAFTAGGNALANVLTGGSGADVLRGRGGADTLVGGDGVDTADYSLAAAGVFARLDNGVVSNDGDGGVDSMTGIENLSGSAFNDTLFGSAGGNELSGGLGRDVILGLAGNDVIRGGSGVANELYGGQGDDTYYVDAVDSIIEAAGEGLDTVITTVANVTLRANVENMTYVGPGDFAGTGNAADNVLTGAGGRDTLRGAGGNDTLNGGAGNDIAMMSGVRADYVIEAIDGGYRITDSVSSRDGVDLLFGMERVRFSDGTTLTLGEPGSAPATVPPLSDKEGEDAFVLPALTDEAGDPLVLPFAADKAIDADPLVLPGAEAAFGRLLSWDHDLVVPGLHGPTLLEADGVAARDDWLI
jgi:Ca2+-binding RTX toxin-like protein